MPKEIILPAISADFESGTIEEWLKQEGDAIAVGDVMLAVETDKAVVEVEAEHAGTLGKILTPAGTEDVAVNTVIGLLLEAGESSDAIDGFTTGSVITTEPVPQESGPQEIAPAPAAAVAAVSVAPVADGTRIFASPLARRIAAQLGVNLTGVKGRGPNGRILKADVEQAAAGSAKPAASMAANTAAPAPAAPAPTPAAAPVAAGHTAIPNNSMRKVIAKRLGESKREVPHFYLSVDCRLDALLALRKELNAQSPEADGAYKLSVNDFIVKASALALRDVPAANASWTDAAILQYHDVDVSVAVATPGGLITPIVRKADTKGLATISDQVKDLAARARDGKLKPEEYQGGGFTISNLGMYGISQFSAIVNPPQSCILAVGAGEQRAIVENGELAVGTVMTCTLSVDHRSVDGAVGAEFLQAFKKYIELPMGLMLRGG